MIGSDVEGLVSSDFASSRSLEPEPEPHCLTATNNIEPLPPNHAIPPTVARLQEQAVAIFDGLDPLEVAPSLARLPYVPLKSLLHAGA